jgi:hypothetical protein
LVATKGELLEKLRKIQTLADRAGTPGEAAAAASKMQELLFRHNLTMFDVLSSRPRHSPTDGFVNQRVNIHWKRPVVHLLLANVSRMNFCRTIYMTGTTDCYVVGMPDDVEAVMLMFDYLFAQVELLVGADWRVYRRNPNRPRGVGWDTYWESYWRGAVDIISDRLQKQRKENEEESSQSMALVVLKDQTVRDAYESFHPDRRPGKGTKVRDVAAYQMGQEAGNRIIIEKQVTDG